MLEEEKPPLSLFIRESIYERKVHHHVSFIQFVPNERFNFFENFCDNEGSNFFAVWSCRGWKENMNVTLEEGDKEREEKGRERERGEKELKREREEKGKEREREEKGRERKRGKREREKERKRGEERV